MLLRVCPNCLGDLVHRTDLSGDYYRCLQCNARAAPGVYAEQLTGVRSVAEPGGRIIPAPGLLPPSITLP